MRRYALLAALSVVAACGGSTADTNPVDACPANVHGCTVYEDHTLDDNPSITFTSFSYSPRCMRIAAGQSITFSGDFAVHPQAQTCGPTLVIPVTTSGSLLQVTFPSPGSWGYQCTAHGELYDMRGAIEVVP